MIVTSLFILSFVIKDSVPVAEVVGVEEGRVEILPRKLVEDTDKDFTGEAVRSNSPHAHMHTHPGLRSGKQ